MDKYLYLFIILMAASYVNCQNLTTSSKHSQEGARKGKTLGIFSVVKFPNAFCVGSSGTNGTCYTSEECAGHSGTSSGSCASGFGVCCIFTMSCGSTTSQNLTYHTVTSFSTSTDGDSPCTYNICPASADVCKIRLDFTTFSIYTPWTSLVLAAGTTGYTPQGIVVNILDGIILGDCLVDQMTVVSPGNVPSPEMCGIGAGQHIYIDASDLCTTVNFAMDTSVTYTRSWSFTATHVECGTDYGKHDCLQYMTGTSGKFSSWNFDTTATTIKPDATLHHLNNQYYDICFRQERGYCKICFDTVITTAGAAAAGPSFGVSGTGDASVWGSSVGHAGCTGLTVYADYIEINNLNNAPVTTSITNAKVSKICGVAFNVIDDTAAAITACSFTTPFRWGVNFDDKEVIVAACSTANTATCENGGGAGGGIGFYMNWWLESC